MQPDGGMNPAELVNIDGQERQHWWYRGMRRVLDSMLRPYTRRHSVNRVLDAGCGTGYNSNWLKTRYGWNVYPVDIENLALRYVRQQGLANATQTDVRALPFVAGSFDIAFCLDVLVHVSRGDEKTVLGELFRALAPGGLAIVRAGAFDALRSRHSMFIHERQRFTRRQLKHLASETGFEIVRCTYANTLLLPVAVAKFRLWEPFLRQPAATGIEATAPWLNTLLYAPLILESMWLRSGFNLPFGQSLLLVARKPAKASARAKEPAKTDDVIVA